MKTFDTLFQDGFGVYEEKKSRFLGEARKIASEEEALQVLQDAKKRYYDARHHCYAYILGDDEVVKCSDDGEPQKTAGLPILNVIRGEGLTNVIVVVTRYFGGTLLGTGGLLRAYTKAAAAAIADAGVVRNSPAGLYALEADYNDFGKIRYFAEEEGLSLRDETYGERVTFKIPVPEEKEVAFVKKITDLTAGRTKPVREAEILMEERLR